MEGENDDEDENWDGREWMIKIKWIKLNNNFWINSVFDVSIISSLL